MNFRRAIRRLAQTAAIIAVLAAVACGQPVSVSVPAANRCAGNTAPQIGLPTLLVSYPAGEPYDIQPPEGDGAIHLKHNNVIVVEKMVVLWFSYIDVDCNLNGGAIDWAIDNVQSVPIAKIAVPAADACHGETVADFVQAKVTDAASKLSNGYGYIVPTAVFQSLSCGPHEFHIGLTDACGAPSQTPATYKIYIQC